MPLALTDAGCLREVWPPAPLNHAAQGTQFCSATTVPSSHNASPTILCLSFPRLLSKDSYGRAGSHHAPSAPAVPQHILSGEDTSGTGQCPGDQCEPHSLGWAWLCTMLLVPEPQPGKLGARREQRQHAQVGQGMETTSLPAPPTPSNGARVHHEAGGAVPDLKNGRQSGSAAAGSSCPHCF